MPMPMPMPLCCSGDDGMLPLAAMTTTGWIIVGSCQVVAYLLMTCIDFRVGVVEVVNTSTYKSGGGVRQSLNLRHVS